MSNQSSIRATVDKDLVALKEVIDTTELFPSAMLDDMFHSGPEDQGQWLTYDKGTPVALAYFVPEAMASNCWNLLLIAVHKHYQGQGIGRQLMQATETAVIAKGARLLLVETSGTDHFEATRAFYHSIGYEQEACIRDFYDQGDDKIVFRKAFQS